MLIGLSCRRTIQFDKKKQSNFWILARRRMIQFDEKDVVNLYECFFPSIIAELLKRIEEIGLITQINLLAASNQ
jgi:hypothetical protein